MKRLVTVATLVVLPVASILIGLTVSWQPESGMERNAHHTHKGHGT